eukprot:1079733-Amphidinium_carterae.1
MSPCNPASLQGNLETQPETTAKANALFCNAAGILKSHCKRRAGLLRTQPNIHGMLERLRFRVHLLQHVAIQPRLLQITAPPTVLKTEAESSNHKCGSPVGPTHHISAFLHE